MSMEFYERLLKHPDFDKLGDYILHNDTPSAFYEYESLNEQLEYFASRIIQKYCLNAYKLNVYQALQNEYCP